MKNNKNSFGTVFFGLVGGAVALTALFYLGVLVTAWF